MSDPCEVDLREASEGRASEDTKLQLLEDQVVRMRFAISATWRKSMQIHGELEKLIGHVPERIPNGHGDITSSIEDVRMEFMRWEKERIEQSLVIEQKALDELQLFKSRLQKRNVCEAPPADSPGISGDTVAVIELQQANTLSRKKLARLTAELGKLSASVKEQMGLSEPGS